MIQDFRNFSQSLIFKLVLGVICITFVFSFGVGSFFGERKEVLATINSEELLMYEYRRLYSQQAERVKLQYGQQAESMIEKLDLKNAILRILIDQHLLRQKAEELGLIVTDTELRDYIQSDAIFQQDGVFDVELYRTLIKQNRLTIYEYETLKHQELVSNKYQDLIRAGLSVSNTEIEQAFKLSNQTVDIEYVYINPRSFEKTITPSDEDLKGYYQKHPQEFLSSEKYKIKYFKLGLDNFKSRESVREREVQRYYEKNQQDYTTPSKIRARHILVKLDDGLTKKQVEEKYSYLETLLKQLKEGADFAELAREHSDDLTKDQGGDLGWFKRGEMLVAIEETAFSLKEGEFSEIIESPFGLHIIQVNEKKPEVVKELAEVRESIIDILVEKRSEKKLQLEYKKLANEVKGAESLESLASLYEVEIYESEFFNRAGIIKGLGSVRDLVKQLKHNPKGHIGRWKRNPVQGHVIFEVIETQPETTQAFSIVKERITRKLKREQAKTVAALEAQKLFEQLNSGTPLEKLIETQGFEKKTASVTLGQQNIPGIGNNPDFKEVSFSLSDSKPYGISQSKQKSYLITFKSKYLDKKSQLSVQRESIKQQLLSQQYQELLKQELKGLRQEADIEILSSHFAAEYKKYNDGISNGGA